MLRWGLGGVHIFVTPPAQTRAYTLASATLRPLRLLRRTRATNSRRLPLECSEVLLIGLRDKVCGCYTTVYRVVYTSRLHIDSLRSIHLFALKNAST